MDRDGRGTAGPILVTGATGFVGGHLVRTLISRGDIAVRATGRDLPAGLALSRLGADFRPVDLTDRAAMVAACKDAAAVVHLGALSSAWGRYEDFHATNVEGTANVIEGCRRHGVERLVHVSSPSVMSRSRHQRGLRESDPLPESFVSAYSETKKLGEDLVREAGAKGLDAVILRPKAIFGPGDRTIFPRLIEAAAKGRLSVIGDGKTVTNLTHVEDVVQAICLALDAPAAGGKTYLITGGEDVPIWEAIGIVLGALGYPTPTRRVSVDKAMALAAAMERAWRVAPCAESLPSRATPSAFSVIPRPTTSPPPAGTSAMRPV